MDGVDEVDDMDEVDGAKRKPQFICRQEAQKAQKNGEIRESEDDYG